MERKLTNVDYHEAPTQCEDCHQNVHGPQFIKTSSVTATVTHCADCHTTNKWRPSLIDHEKTTFSLRGAHQNVRCGACHNETEQVDGKAVVVYKLAPSKCAACHGNSLGNRAT
jgi:NAD-dependent SIR2 family protein deacetylase